jgi:hypothetical protein
VDDRGKDFAPAAAEVEALARQGQIVLSIDVRGCGETADRMCRRKNLGRNYGIENLAIQLGRPLLGQRVDDILCAADVLADREDVAGLRLVGCGNAGPVALHAAALDERFESVSLRNSIRSWSEALEATEMDLGGAVFGALANYDLPDLVTSISPREVEFSRHKLPKPTRKRR